jgi:hypothetical protein
MMNGQVSTLCDVAITIRGLNTSVTINQGPPCPALFLSVSLEKSKKIKGNVMEQEFLNQV